MNGIGRGSMRYQYMTPDDFSDDVNMTSGDILKAFKGLSSTHGIPHVSNARGTVTIANMSRYSREIQRVQWVPLDSHGNVYKSLTQKWD